MDIRLNDKLANLLILLGKKHGTSAEEQVVGILHDYFHCKRWRPGAGSPHDGFKDSILPSVAEELLAEVNRESYQESPPPPQTPPSAPSRTPV